MPRRFIDFRPPTPPGIRSEELDYSMPYLLVSTQMRLECGPTCVGDGNSDPELMQYLQASKKKQLGNMYEEYISPLAPREVLNLLEEKGWTVIGMCGIGQTCAWTLKKTE